jgi:hypothetical protein
MVAAHVGAVRLLANRICWTAQRPGGLGARIRAFETPLAKVAQRDQSATRRDAGFTSVAGVSRVFELSQHVEQFAAWMLQRAQVSDSLTSSPQPSALTST